MLPTPTGSRGDRYPPRAPGPWSAAGLATSAWSLQGASGGPGEECLMSRHGGSSEARRQAKRRRWAAERRAGSESLPRGRGKHRREAGWAPGVKTLADSREDR